MKRKLFNVVLVLIAATTIFAACSKTQNYDDMTKIVFYLEGGTFQNSERPVTYYYPFEKGTENLIKEPTSLSDEKITRNGYVLEGWYREKSEADGKTVYSGKWNFETDRVSDEGITLYACWKKNVEYTFNVCYYVVEGTTITVYDGETSTAYGIDVANKLFLGKSKFAGLTFIGSFVDGWGDPNSMRIVFDDSTEISGVVYAGSGTTYYFNFTAVLEGNVLTFTFGQNINGSSTVGKTMTATISGDTMTITSCDISNNAYTFANDGSVTCSGFSI